MEYCRGVPHSYKYGLVALQFVLPLLFGFNLLYFMVVAERLHNEGLQVLGVSIASVAVTGLATGAATPAAGFGLFLMLLGGLSLAIIPVLRGRGI